MNLSVDIREPELLCEQPMGGLFVCHSPATCDLVLMRVMSTPQLSLPAPDVRIPVVVLGNRGIGKRDPGFVPTGAVLLLDGKCSVTVLVQDEPARVKGVFVPRRDHT